jgi:hypothetical protein
VGVVEEAPVAAARIWRGGEGQRIEERERLRGEGEAVGMFSFQIEWERPRGCFQNYR